MKDDEGEEAILFLTEERGNSPYTQAAKIIWATHENLESVEKLIAEWDGR